MGTTSLLPLLEKSDQPRVVTVSSGGMLVQKLDVEDLQFEKLAKYDGTMAYAQNKRQQVELSSLSRVSSGKTEFQCLLTCLLPGPGQVKERGTDRWLPWRSSRRSSPGEKKLL